MKTFVAIYKIFEGEKSNYKKLLIKAPTKQEAEKIAESQEHDATPKKGDAQNKLTWFDYGDGSTIAVFKGLNEIGEEDAFILHEEAGINYFDPSL